MGVGLVSPVFVGRGVELGVLGEGLVGAGVGVPGVVLIAGEAGVGKTRLLEEFLGRAEAAGAVTAVGGCIELGASALPFAPVGAALRGLEAVLPERFAAAVAGREGDLARLAPGLVAERVGAADLDGPADRLRLYDLTLHLLDTLGADRTLVIAIEDLHWADSATRELLTYWVRALRRTRVLLVATYRADAVDRRHPLRPVLAELDRLRTVRRLDLERLTRDQVAEQLRGILGEEPSHQLVAQIHDRSEGNAFFVEELAESVRDGRLTRLPDSLRDLLLIRIEQLPDAAQRVVRLVAVGGTDVPHRLLAQVAAAHVGLDADALDTALRDAIGAHVLAPARDGDGYTFRHALVREAALDDLLPGERMRSHAAFAHALEEDPGLVGADEAVGRLAVHWWHAENPARALPALLTAAARARDRYAFGEQLRLLDGALDMWERLPDPAGLTGATQLDIIEAAALAARYHNAPERGLALLRTGLDLVDADADPMRAAHLWIARSHLLRTTARASGHPELRQAEALLATVPQTGEHATVLTLIARGQLLDGEAAEAVRAAREALEMARNAGDVARQADIAKMLAWFLLSVGEVDEARAVGYESVRLAEHVDTPDILVSSLANHSSLLEGLGEHEESVALARRGLDVAQERGLRYLAVFTAGNLSESLLSLGRWAEVDEVAAEAFALGPGMRAPGPAHLERLLGELAANRGDEEVAQRHRARAHAAARQMYLEPQSAIPQRTLDLAAARREGDLATVRELVAAQLADGVLAGHQRYGWPFLAEAARAAAEATANHSAQPDPAQLQDLRALAATLELQCDLDRAYAASVAALLDQAGSATPPDDLADRWRTAVAAWQRTGKPHDRARATLDLAHALAAAGHRAEAEAELREARKEADRLGARPLAAEAELLGRRLGMTDHQAPGPATPGASLAASLTPREREVLARLALGHSNRRIAEDLFISAKTASVHVSNILAKLEVTGRGEAAAVAHRLGLAGDAGDGG